MKSQRNNIEKNEGLTREQYRIIHDVMIKHVISGGRNSEAAKKTCVKEIVRQLNIEDKTFKSAIKEIVKRDYCVHFFDYNY